jgi:peptidoglycan-N-acetylglucosamine deacetylase
LAAASALLTQPRWFVSLLGRVFPDVLWRVDTQAPLVALTFDDGPAPDHTPRVLEVLARHRARATFFLVGDRAQAYPALVQRLRDEGHEVGNHSYTLRSALKLPDGELRAQMLRTEAVLGLAGPVKLYRPPGGLIRARALADVRAHGYRCVLGSAYPFDGQRPPSGYIRWLVSKNLAPGAIVILHDGIADPSRMLAALDAILVAGEAKGLRFVTVGELLASAPPP